MLRYIFIFSNYRAEYWITAATYSQQVMTSPLRYHGKCIWITRTLWSGLYNVLSIFLGVPETTQVSWKALQCMCLALMKSLRYAVICNYSNWCTGGEVGSMCTFVAWQSLLKLGCHIKYNIHVVSSSMHAGFYNYCFDVFLSGPLECYSPCCKCQDMLQASFSKPDSKIKIW